MTSSGFEEECVLGRGSPTCADDADGLVVPDGVNDHHEAPLERPDGDEAILEVGVGVVKDLEVVAAGREQLASFLEGNPCLRTLARFFARSQVIST